MSLAMSDGSNVNRGASIDVSPAVRDYLKLESLDLVTGGLLSDGVYRLGPGLSTSSLIRKARLLLAYRQGCIIKTESEALAHRWKAAPSRQLLRRAFAFVAHYFHRLGKIAFRGSIISLGNCYKDGVEYVELSDSSGCILAEKRGTAGCRS
jgi:hypothetical protein